MKNQWSIPFITFFVTVTILMTAFGNKTSPYVTPTEIDYEKEERAILALIDKESEAFWDKDFERWAACWVQAPYIRTMGWWERGGITVVKGWEERGPRTKEHMADNPEPNPQNVVRKNINMRIYQDAAWVTFDQYGKDTGEPDMDMPGLSRETRILEKHDDQWKIVYVGWLLEGENP
jgi:hypothetical protein